MFADLNKYTIRPSKSLGVLYDHRDPLAGLVRDLMLKVPLFRDRIEKERTTISNRSLKLFTLSSVYQATKALLGKKKKQEQVTQADSEIATQFWTELPRWIPEWSLLLQGKLTSGELRREYVHAHGVLLQALGVAGNALYTAHPDSWKSILARLKGASWEKSDPNWKRRVMVAGRLSKAQTNLILATNYVKQRLGLKLTQQEDKVERENLNR
jgi:DNA sulfur modification protein DndB